MKFSTDTIEFKFYLKVKKNQLTNNKQKMYHFCIVSFNMQTMMNSLYKPIRLNEIYWCNVNVSCIKKILQWDYSFGANKPNKKLTHYWNCDRHWIKHTPLTIKWNFTWKLTLTRNYLIGYIEFFVCFAMYMCVYISVLTCIHEKCEYLPREFMYEDDDWRKNKKRATLERNMRLEWQNRENS